MQNILQSLELIAGSIESGYSSVFTYAIKQKLNNTKRTRLVNLLRKQTEVWRLESELQITHLPVFNDDSSRHQVAGGTSRPPFSQ